MLLASQSWVGWEEYPVAGPATGANGNRAPRPNGPEILVVGAGAAGLAAAWTLAVRHKHSNCRTRVLEASDKIGGRMFCEEIDGFHVYGGASVIHESFTTTRDLARELDVELLQRELLPVYPYEDLQVGDSTLVVMVCPWRRLAAFGRGISR